MTYLKQHVPGTVHVETLGCKLNLADSEILVNSFQKAGFKLAHPGSSPSIYILNTCTVTHVADRKARHLLRNVRKRYPDALIVATGCYAQRDKEALEDTGVVDIVAGNESKPRLVEIVRDTLGVGDDISTGAEHYPMRYPIPLRDASELSQARDVRSFLKIQEGCNDVCSYCIIPKVRGRSHHFSIKELVQQVQAKEAEGCREVVLTGTQLGDYGLERPGRTINNRPEGGQLVQLLQALLDETSVPRVRVSSLQPQDIDERLLELWSDPRMCQHFHMPLQSGDDEVLSSMRRRYTVEEFSSAVEAIRRHVPNVSITTDLIVGYPGETQEAFDESYRFCNEMHFAAIHLFPYSVREGTSAARIKEQVHDKIKRERMDTMLKLASESTSRFLNRMVGVSFPVLWEEQKTIEGGGSPRTAWSGLTDNYIRVYAHDTRDLRGHITYTRLVSVAANGFVWGELQEKNELTQQGLYGPCVLDNAYPGGRHGLGGMDCSQGVGQLSKSTGPLRLQ